MAEYFSTFDLHSACMDAINAFIGDQATQKQFKTRSEAGKSFTNQGVSEDE